MTKEPTIDIADKGNRIGPAIWLGLLTISSLAKITVGSLYLTGGCLGITLLPYYFLFQGVLALAPALIALLSSFYRKSRELEEFWGCMAKLFFMSVVLLIAATIYTLVTASHVTTLDRLCTERWVPIFGFLMLVTDWVLFAVFFRLFCVNDVSEETRRLAFNNDFLQSESPFLRWKRRRHDRF